MLPAESFVNIGLSLNNEDSSSYPNSHHVGESKEKNYSGFINLNSSGILLDGSESKDLSIESVDIETFNEMFQSFSRKSRISNIIILFLLIIIAYLIHQLYMVEGEQKTLTVELEKMKKERKAAASLVELSSSKNTKLDEHCTRDSLVEVSNCYFNIHASASIGECGRSMINEITDWYANNLRWDDYSSGNDNQNNMKSTYARWMSMTFL